MNIDGKTSMNKVGFFVYRYIILLFFVPFTAQEETYNIPKEK